MLETVYIWGYLNNHKVQACAPTGIAAARLRIPRTPVRAYTVHYLFALSVELESKIDPSKDKDERTERLAKTTVLIVDEASMIDDRCWDAMKDQLTTVGALHLRDQGSVKHPAADDYGRVHLILACDLKQLPPATARPPCIAGDTKMLDTFAFRMLRQNRRLQEGSDAFHGTLEDIGAGVHSDQVRQFLIEAYKRGAEMTQDNVGFEDSTACFTKRRYRDRWNRRVLVRLGKNISASLKSRPSSLRKALTAPL